MKIRCDCGGALRRVTLRGYDFSADAGLPVTLARAPGWRCPRCGGETLDGATIAAALSALTVAIVIKPERMTAEEARFLRKTMGATQRELAVRMSVARETVAAWECGQHPISPHLDHVLRAFALAHVAARLPSTKVADAVGALGAVRTAGATQTRIELDIGGRDAA